MQLTLAIIRHNNLGNMLRGIVRDAIFDVVYCIRGNHLRNRVNVFTRFVIPNVVKSYLAISIVDLGLKDLAISIFKLELELIFI